MLFSKLKDLKKRKLYNKNEKFRIIKKFVVINLLSRLINKYKTGKKREVFFLLLSKYKFDLSVNKTQLVRRCIFTNRSRGIVRPYNISRLSFKKLSYFGLIPGVKKAIW